MTKKTFITLLQVLVIAIIISFIFNFGMIMLTNYIDNTEIEKKAEYNKCVRIIVNEDEIADGCDKYFLNDKWYNDFMKQMFDEYEKIK